MFNNHGSIITYEKYLVFYCFLLLCLLLLVVRRKSANIYCYPFVQRSIYNHMTPFLLETEAFIVSKKRERSVFHGKDAIICLRIFFGYHNVEDMSIDISGM